MTTAEADLGLTTFALDEQFDSQKRFLGDEKLYVRFYIYPVHDAVASAAEGRPIFKDAEWVHIQVPGDRNNIIQRPASEFDKMRFQARYEAFKKNNQESTDGTALEQWPRITRAQVEELKYFGCRTVEQLANMSDVNASKFPGVGMLRTWARDYIDQAKSTAAASQMRAELDERDNRISAMEIAMAEMAETIKALKEQAE